MKLFVTDNEKEYNSRSVSGKALIVKGVIAATDILDEGEVSRLNIAGGGTEDDCAAIMLQRLREAVSRPVEIEWPTRLGRHPAPDRLWAMLYPNLKLYLLPALHFCSVLDTFIDALPHKPDQVDCMLSQDLFLAAQEKTKHAIPHTFRFLPSPGYGISSLKRLFYAIHDYLPSGKKPVRGKTHILVFAFDTPNDLGLFRYFLGRIKERSDIYVSLVIISSGNPPGTIIRREEWRKTGADVYLFQEFRCRVVSRNLSFYSWASSVDPSWALFGIKKYNDHHDVYFAFARRALERLRPDVVIYDNLAEPGRAVSDACAETAIPAVNLEYGLFTDDNIHMESRIRFDAKACLGESSARLWKKRGDPTPLHATVGLLRLDELHQKKFNRKELLKKYSLPVGKKILFFASTWSAGNRAHDHEKKELVKWLAEHCRKNDLVLVVKKHPSEFDTILEDHFQKERPEGAFLFSHGSMDLYDAIFLSEICSSQASSISVEALYFRKPVLFFSLSAKKSLAELSLMKNEPFCRICKGKEQIAEGINYFLTNPVPAGVMEEGIRKYLTADDGMSWRRLADLCLGLIRKA